MPQQSYTENDVIEAILDVTDNDLSQHTGRPEAWNAPNRSV
jgi:hypothetical protein